MKINIIKSSIKRNPNAGNTVTIVPGRRDVTGIYYGQIPEYLEPLIVITEQNRYSDGNTESFFMLNGEPPAQLLQDKNCQLQWAQENIRCEHLPEPDYFYKYENPPIECSECKVKTKLNDIETDWVDDEYKVYICPNCQSTEGYPEFQYQSITEALNERGEVLK